MVGTSAAPRKVWALRSRAAGRHRGRGIRAGPAGREVEGTVEAAC